MMQVKTFCGCCSLQIGSIIIGIATILCTIFVFILEAIGIDHIENIESPEFKMSTYFIVKAIYVGVMSYLVICMIISIQLIIGSIKRKASYVFPFVCLAYSNVIMQLAISIGIMVFTFGYPLPAIMTYVNFLILSLLMGAYVYIWLVAYSFYKELMLEKYGYSPNQENKNYEPYKGYNV
ncbi:GSCOCG00009799001-RA-CDS [Cotesia congregata]|nr:GSCOCG00009799001-RA-CDS [Cotesia congregata]